MVDLIPHDYRRSLRLRRWLRGFGLACAGAALLTGLARAGLAYLVRAEQSDMAEIRKAEIATGAHRSKLAGLQARRDAAERELKALGILRDRAVIGELFFAIDTAFAGKVWFDELSFLRECEVTEAKPEAREPGHIIVVPPGTAPQGGGNRAGERIWLAQQRAQIRGHALDHSTLAEFVNRLSSQPGIGQVRLVDTGARSYSSLQVVDFRLAASLGPRPGAPR